MTATEDELKRGMEPVPHRRADKSELVTHFMRDLPEIMRPRVETYMSALFDRLSEEAEADEEIWICRSRYVGPLAGHEGVGLVRDGSVVRYERVTNY